MRKSSQGRCIECGMGSKTTHGRRQMMQAVIIEATLTCPACGAVSRAEMPLDACQFFYECPHCRTLLRPNAGDCCVFCSYADVRCPDKLRATAR